MLLQFTTARIVTNHDTGYNNLRQVRYYKSRQLLLQFTTGITIYDVITIHDSTNRTSFVKNSMKPIFYKREKMQFVSGAKFLS